MPNGESDRPLVAARTLESALLLTFVVHAAAMIGMATCLLPGVPGGTSPDVAGRAAFVAGHPWVWRLGWLGWQLTAASDLYLAVALCVTRWIPRRIAVATLAVTVAALVPDQVGQFLWSVTGPSRAAESLASGDFAAYAEFEAGLFQAIGGWAAALYLTAALGWTACLWRAGTWSVVLRNLSIACWGVFAIGVALLCLPRGTWTPLTLGVAGGLNAVAFVLLLCWIAEAGERVMRRSRPVEPYGRHAEWRSPRRGNYGRVADYLANGRFVRGLFEYVLPLAMRSDVRDVVYVNYLADADTLARHVPAPLVLQRLGPGGGLAVLSILTYRHGHFGPRVFGPLRRLWRSPIQSNWRLYVTDPTTNRDGVLFLTTAIDATPYALAARLLSEGVPMHVPHRAELSLTPTGTWTVALQPGVGSSPDLDASLRPASGAAEFPAWRTAFATWRDVLTYCVPQDRALNVQPWYGRSTRQEIDLGIPPDACVPLVGTVRSVAARAITGDAEAFCFYVPKVDFSFDAERYDSWK